MNKEMMDLIQSITSMFGNDAVTIKAFENGKPIVNIENGVNKLNEAIMKKSLEGNPDYIKVPKSVLIDEGIKKYDIEETKDKDFVFVPRKDIMDDIENSKADNKPNNEVMDLKKTPSTSEDWSPLNEDSEEEFYGPGERFTDITPNIIKDDFDETYIIKNSVSGKRTPIETVITFDETMSDGLTNPGVTDEDLLWILMFRNRENTEIFNALHEVLTKI